MEKIIDINELVQDQHNFNKGTEEGQRLVEKSFKELGAGRSILIDKDGQIIAGNKSQKAAIAAGITKVRVIETTGDELVAVMRTDLSIDSAEGRALAYADNSTQQANLEWDMDELQAVQAEVEGFDPSEWGLDIEDSISPDDFGDEFSLPEGDKSPFTRYGFMLANEQYEAVTNALKMAKNDQQFKTIERFDNSNENGNALYLIIKQWEEQKKLS